MDASGDGGVAVPSTIVACGGGGGAPALSDGGDGLNEAPVGTKRRIDDSYMATDADEQGAGGGPLKQMRVDGVGKPMKLALKLMRRSDMQVKGPSGGGAVADEISDEGPSPMAAVAKNHNQAGVRDDGVSGEKSRNGDQAEGAAADGVGAQNSSIFKHDAVTAEADAKADNVAGLAPEGTKAPTGTDSEGRPALAAATPARKVRLGLENNENRFMSPPNDKPSRFHNERFPVKRKWKKEWIVVSTMLGNGLCKLMQWVPQTQPLEDHDNLEAEANDGRTRMAAYLDDRLNSSPEEDMGPGQYETLRQRYDEDENRRRAQRGGAGADMQAEASGGATLASPDADGTRKKKSSSKRKKKEPAAVGGANGDGSRVPPPPPRRPPPPTSVGQFKCDFEGCGKICFDRAALKKHMQIHGARQYVCTYEGCGKKFQDSSKLKRHFLTHTGEKNHVCTICNKAFSLDFNLKTHMRIHTGDKRECPVVGCQKKFIHAYKLKSHLNTHGDLSQLEMKQHLNMDGFPIDDGANEAAGPGPADADADAEEPELPPPGADVCPVAQPKPLRADRGGEDAGGKAEPTGGKDAAAEPAAEPEPARPPVPAAPMEA